MLGLAWMWACLLIGGGFLWSGLTGDSPSPQRLIAASTLQPAPVVAKYETKSIRNIRVGERVLAHNPELSDSERADAIEPDPATWRRIQFVMRKADGGSLEIELLRPVDWLLDHAEQFVASEQPGWFVADQLLNSDQTCERALLGRTIDLDLAELGAAGPAELISITPCPPIEPSNSDNRQVVTGTFKHSSGNVLDLSIAGEPKPIGTTANHPFWSEDRQAFIPAGELSIGERLRHADGSITSVTRINPRATPEVVHNLEINSEHVYYVGHDGVLVHNSCPHGNSLLSTAANHGYAIFNSITGRVLKFGVSSQRIARNGQSYRVTTQLRQLRARGIEAHGEVLDRFANRTAALQWESGAVTAFRGQGWDLAEQLLPR